MPGSTVSRHNIILDADTQRLNRSLGNAERRFRQTRDRIIRRAGEIARSTTTALVGLTAAFGAAARSSIEFADEIQKGAQFANLAAEDYQALQFALTQNGIEQSRLNNLLRGSANVINEARKGLATYTDILDDLNISQSQFSTTDQVQNLQVFLDALRETEDITLRNASAARIFGGRIGQTAIALVNQSANLEEYRAQLERVGGLINDETANSAASAVDAIDLLTRTIRAQFTNALLANVNSQEDFEERIRSIGMLVFDLTRAFTRLIEFIIDNRVAIQRLIQVYALYRGVRGVAGAIAFTNTFRKQLLSAADAANRANKASRIWLVNLVRGRRAAAEATQATAAAATASTGRFAAVSAFFTSIGMRLAPLTTRLTAIGASIATFFTRFGRFALVGIRFVPVLGQIATVITAIVAAFAIWRDGLTVTQLRLEIFGLQIVNTFNRVQLFLLNLPTHVRNLLNRVRELWEVAWQNIVTLWNNTLNAIISALEPVLEIISNAWDRAMMFVRTTFDNAVMFLRMTWDNFVMFWTSGIDAIVDYFLDLPNRIRQAFDDVVAIATNAIEPVLLFLDRLRREPLTVLREVAGAVGRSLEEQVRRFLPFLFRDAEQLAEDIRAVDERIEQRRLRIAQELADRNNERQAQTGEMAAEMVENAAAAIGMATTNFIDDANDCVQSIIKTGEDAANDVATAACDTLDTTFDDMDFEAEVSIEAERIAQTIVDAIRNGGWDMVGQDIVGIFADAAARRAEETLTMLIDNFFTAIGGLFNNQGGGQGGGFLSTLFSGFGQGQGADFVGPQLPGAGGAGAGALGLFSSLFGFHEGGIVPGRRGQEVPAVLEAGEAVLTTRQQEMLMDGFRNMGGVSINNEVRVVGNLDAEQRRFLDRNSRENAIRVQNQLAELGQPIGG